MAISVALQGVLLEFAPLFGLSFSIFALKGLRVSHSARWAEGFWMHLLDIILSSAIGAFLIVGFCLTIMSFQPINELTLVGLTVFLSVGGVSLVDSIIFKYFGVRILEYRAKCRERGGEEE